MSHIKRIQSFLDKIADTMPPGPSEDHALWVLALITLGEKASRTVPEGVLENIERILKADKEGEDERGNTQRRAH